MKTCTTRRDVLKAAALSALSLPLMNLVSPTLHAGESAAPAPRDKRQPGLRLGVASFTLNKLPVEDVIATLKRLELDAVSLYRAHAPWSTGTVEECRTVVQKFADAGITVMSTGVIDFTTDEAAARKAFDNVRGAGLKTLCGRPTLEALPLVDKLVKEYDVRVAIHNHGPTDLYPTGHDVWQAIQPFDRRIGVCLDVGHGFRAGGDPVAAIFECRDRLHQFHIKDTLGPGGTGTKDPTPVVVGHGILDIRGIVAALLEIKCACPIEFEYEERIEDKLPGLAESVGYVRGLLAGLAR